MGFRMLTRNKQAVTANIYALLVVEGSTSFKDAYKRLITSITPASATAAVSVGSSSREHSSSWQTACWGAAAAAFLGATTTIGLAETAESAAPPTAEKVCFSFSFFRPPSSKTLPSFSKPFSSPICHLSILLYRAFN